MNLQYITDSKGETTGVFIPIEEWNSLKSRYEGLEKEEIELPEWHKNILQERLEQYKTNPAQASDFDEAMEDIEKDL